MKKISTFIIVLFATLSSFSQKISITEVVTAMKAGNAAQVARFFDTMWKLVCQIKVIAIAKARLSWY